jgi:hypothetical protein
VQRVLLAAAAAAGLLVTYVDSRPNWDDTGITVFALLFLSGIIGLFVRLRPWLFGLAIGIWLPLGAIILTHDLRFLGVLVFPMAGVYAGWGLRRLAIKPPPSS